MNKLFRTAIISVVISAFVVGNCSGAVLKSEQIIKNVETKAKEYVKTQVNGDIAVDVVKLPYETLELPDGEVDFKVSMNTKYFSQKTIARVKVLVNGNVEKSFGVPLSIIVEDYVLVAADNIQRGKAFNASNVKLEKRNISKVAKEAIKGDFLYADCYATKNFRPGEIITKKYVQGVPDVKKNSLVTVIFKTPYIKLVIDGVAMEDGRIGDYVKVKNKKYRKYYTGKVINENQILVKI